MMNFSYPVRRSRATAALMAALAMSLLPLTLSAGEIKQFNIKSQPLLVALGEFARQSDRQILFSTETVAAKETTGISGSLDAEAALRMLLKGTGLTYRITEENTILVEARYPNDRKAGNGRQDVKFLLARAEMPAEYAVADEETPTTEEKVAAGELEVFGERILTRNRAATVEPVLVYESGYFERFEPLTLNDMLKRVPGVYFDTLFNLPQNAVGGNIADTGSTLPRFRNLDTQLSQILINGRRIAGIDFGSGSEAFLATIPAEAVQEIRVIRSPSAAIDSAGVGMTLDVVLKDGSNYSDSSWRLGGAYVDGELEGVGSVNVRGSAERYNYSLSATSQNRTGTGRSVSDSTSVRLLTLPTVTSTTETSSQALTLSSQRDADRSVIGNFAFSAGSRGRFNLEGKYVETGRTAATDQSGIRDSVVTQAFSDGSTAVSASQQAIFGRTATRRESSNYGLALAYDHDFGAVQWSTLGGYDRTDLETTTVTSTRAASGEIYVANIAAADGKGERYQFNNHLLWSPRERHSLHLGLDWQRTMDSNPNSIISNPAPGVPGTPGFFSNDTQTVKRSDLFAVYEWQVSDTLSAQAGARYERARYASRAAPVVAYVGFTEDDFQFDPEVLSQDRRTDFSATVSGLNPSVHLRWSIAPDHDLRLSVARTVRRPTIDELDPEVLVVISAEPSFFSEVGFGNPQLKNEEALGVDLGYDWRFRDGIIGLNVFHRRIENLIELAEFGVITSQQFTGLRPELAAEVQRLAQFLAAMDPPQPLQLLGPINSAKTTKVEGVELDMSFPLAFISDAAHLYMNATYSQQRRAAEPSIESSAVNLAYDHQFQSIGLTYGASFNWVTRDKDHSEIPGILEFNRVRELQPNVEMFLEKKLGRSLLVRATVENLFDAEEEQVIDQQLTGFVNNTSHQVRLTESDPRFLLTFRGRF